ncbi:MAG: ammonia-forming cytochrome c nitrite reductase subunit c552 [Opitutae bacterium]|nr:ammonia-forming cytochrome c nitrite reductase subunit c552 [Opitutae bacterium]
MSTIFPKQANKVPAQVVIALLLMGGALTAGITYYFTPKYSRVGYQPTQPVPFEHSLHAGELGIDCRFCHNHVDKSGHSNVPSTNSCMICLNQIQLASDKLELVRASFATGEPIPWVQVHKLPDYVYFNHSVHVNRGISCYECHGQVNEMDVVHHVKPFSMAFCLDCHRNPEEKLRPPEEVFNLDWRPESEEAQLEFGREAKEAWRVNPPVGCAGCHR